MFLRNFLFYDSADCIKVIVLFTGLHLLPFILFTGLICSLLQSMNVCFIVIAAIISCIFVESHFLYYLVPSDVYEN